jgi:hypothetical protein
MVELVLLPMSATAQMPLDTVALNVNLASVLNLVKMAGFVLDRTNAVAMELDTKDLYVR